MQNTFILIIVVTLCTACHRKSEPSKDAAETFLSPLSPSNAPPGAPPIAAWGATKDDILAKLARMKVRVVRNTEDLIVAEAGPEGLTDGNGRPIKTDHPLRTEYYFKNGKLVGTKCL